MTTATALEQTRVALQTRPGSLRSQIVRGVPKDAVDREGGDFSAGLIRRISVNQRGEALGHYVWLDTTFLQQTADAINDSGETGIKARFTHPDMSSDGLGTFLGRVKDARVEGDRVLADLHLAKSAHDTPDGDLAGYVMDRAGEDPESFGESIVFYHDQEAETEFLLEHGATVDGRWIDTSRFESPDEENEQNLPHARLKELRAVDTVDEPAANRQGLFHRGRRATARDAEMVLSYALGLSDECPELEQLDIDPDRIAGFVSRFCDRNHLQFSVMEPDAMADTPATTPEKKADNTPTTRDQFTAELKRFTTRFGAKGADWFAEGVDFETALERHVVVLEEKLKARDEEIELLKKEKEQLRSGEETPVDTGSSDGETRPGNGTRFGVRLASSVASAN